MPERVPSEGLASSDLTDAQCTVRSAYSLSGSVSFYLRRAVSSSALPARTVDNACFRRRGIYSGVHSSSFTLLIHTDRHTSSSISQLTQGSPKHTSAPDSLWPMEDTDLQARREVPVAEETRRRGEGESLVVCQPDT